MKRVLQVAAVAVCSLASSAALADGWYVSGNVGANIVRDADNSGDVLDIESSYDTGWVLNAAIGRSFANGFRAEGEISYRKADLDELDVTNAGGTSVNVGLGEADGDVSALSFMANGWYDFKTGTKFTPYIGGGIGLSKFSANDVAVLGVSVTDDSDTVFAYQFGVGGAYALTEKVSLTLDYRYFATADPNLKASDGSDFDTEYQSHNIMAGVRYTF